MANLELVCKMLADILAAMIERWLIIINIGNISIGLD